MSHEKGFITAGGGFRRRLYFKDKKVCTALQILLCKRIHAGAFTQADYQKGLSVMQVASMPMESLAELLQLQLDTGGVARLVVTGSSMHPTFRHRKDVVYLTPVDRELKRGDLILYRRATGQFILHRIVSRPKNEKFFCCGDNQWQKEPVEASQVMALVNGFVRYGKEQTPKTFCYRLRVGFWIMIFPLRRPILAMRRFAARIFRKSR